MPHIKKKRNTKVTLYTQWFDSVYSLFIFSFHVCCPLSVFSLFLLYSVHCKQVSVNNVIHTEALVAVLYITNSKLQKKTYEGEGKINW